MATVYTIGPCTATFNSQAFETHGGVKIDYTENVQHVFKDLSGTTPVDGIFTGAEMYVEVPITDPTWAILAKAFPESIAVVATNDYITITNPVGTMLLDNDALLTLDPIQNSASDEDNMFYFPQASPVAGPVHLDFDTSNQRVWLVKFHILPDSNGILGRQGDPVA